MCKHCENASAAPISRRSVLRAGAGAAAAAGLLATPLRHVFAEESTAQVSKDLTGRGRAKQVVLLFMNGGASHLDTFDPKPGATTQGPTRSVDTAVSGVKIAASLPEIAKRMGDIALVRGMTSKEGNHERARYLMHTGYPPTPTVVHAGLGTIVSHELGR